MILQELNYVFDYISANTLGVNSYWAGWASDRTRSRATNDLGEEVGAEYPKITFTPPQGELRLNTSKNAYSCTLIFDDLLGYNNDGSLNESTQFEKWSILEVLVERFFRGLQSYTKSILPDYISLDSSVSKRFDSFSSTQRLVSIVVTFDITTPVMCEFSPVFPLPPTAWPPDSVVPGDWIKGKQEFIEVESRTLVWTYNSLFLPDNLFLNVYQNGQLLLSSQYIVNENTVVIRFDYHVPGSSYVIEAVWKV